MNPKEFFKKWKKGMKELSPLQLLQAKMAGHLGGAIGLILALVSLWLRDMKFFSVFLIAMTWLQLVEYKSVKQQFEAAKDLIELQESNEVQEKM